MRACRVLFASAFLTDCSLYLLFAAIPFRALELGAGPVALGAAPGLYAVGYMASAAAAGRLSDRVPRLRLARIAALAAGILAAGLAAAGTLPALYAVLPLLGAAAGFFWSPLQAALSDRALSRELGRALGMFNVSWTSGKGFGLVLGGYLTAALSPRWVLLLGGLPVLLAAALLPRGEAPHAAAPAPEDPHRAAPATLLGLAWMANALAYGLVGTVNMHGARLMLAEGAGPAVFGAFLGAVFGVQVLAFLVFSGRPAGRPLVVAALACAVAAAALFPGLPGAARFLVAIPFGAATGLAYHASLHASLHRPHGRGRAAGLHETLIGAGNSTVPLLGGIAASVSGSLSAPFLVAAALIAAGLVAALAVRAAPPARATS
jgi:MFS family permease